VRGKLFFPPARDHRPSYRRRLALGHLVVAVLLVTGAAHAERDFGVSYNLLLKADIADDWFVVSRSNLATRNDNEDEFLTYTGAAIGRQLTDTWSARVGYRHARLRLGDKWRPEDRPFFEAYGRASFDGWQVSNRARVEFRFFDHRDNDVRLRNEIGIEAPLPLTALGLRPFVEDEVFYSTEGGQFEANWLTLGLAWRPVKGTKLKAAYRWNRFRVGDDWRDRDVLVLGLNLFF
jgi:hypothetical protein